MGRPKLLLPWSGPGDPARSCTVIEQVLAAWQASRVDHLAVVVDPRDVALADICRYTLQWQPTRAAVVVADQPPADMKASVALGLSFIRATWSPTADDVWLTAPADLPLLSPTTIDLVLAAFDPSCPEIVVPVYRGRRGHPILVPWTLADAAARLPSDAGLRQLLDEHPVREVAAGADSVGGDVDTPADYRRLSVRRDRDSAP